MKAEINVVLTIEIENLEEAGHVRDAIGDLDLPDLTAYLQEADLLLEDEKVLSVVGYAVSTVASDA